MSQEHGEAAGFAGPAPGTFCWTEIASTDAAKCRDFYAKVFGWQFQGSEAATDGFAYNEFTTGGEGFPAGGLYELTQEMKEAGVAPHFITYIAVDDVDENARRAIELGGSVMKEPADIPNAGRFAIIKDPTGAMFATFRMQ